MNLFLAIPYDLRLAALFVLGLCAGGLINWAIYRLAYFPRAISPWSSAPDAAPRRWPLDRLPIFGWIALRRESRIFGRGHWVRPLVIELAVGILFAWLYDWEIGQAGLMPTLLPVNLLPPIETLHAAYFSHLALFLLMIAASFIDIDEMIIPDTITVPGALVGLLLAAVLPTSLLPVLVIPAANKPPVIDFLRLTSPNDWPAWLDGSGAALALGLACFGLWCFALLPRPWRTRHGWGRAVRILLARLMRETIRPLTLAIEILGVVGIVWCWSRGGLAWQALLTSLVGLAAGGGIVWLVRIFGTFSLKREALGFGDVTLMAMIGAFLGWQPCLIIFFIAPFAGLVIGIGQWIVNRGREIPYGPFLCLATALVVIRWRDVWDMSEHIFQLGGYVPAVLGVCLVLMTIMLSGWRMIKERAAK